MDLIDDLLTGTENGVIADVRIGLHWTAVVAQVGSELRCGLSAAVGGSHEHSGEPDVPMAGGLAGMPGRDLANLARSEREILASLGLAAINALLPRDPRRWIEGNAEGILASLGRGKRVVIVGHFPFVGRLRRSVRELVVLEQRPRAGDLPAEAAPDVVPAADVVAITAMALVNRTLEPLLGLCKPGAIKMLLGPTTPLSPLLLDHGLDLLSGSDVVAIDPVLRTLGQGGNFHQIHQAGVRLVTLARPGLALGL